MLSRIARSSPYRRMGDNTIVLLASRSLAARAPKSKAVKSLHNQLNTKTKAPRSEWMKRHLKDPYVDKAQKDGYRARSAYKLLEINKKHSIIKKGAIVVDLGAAPGGWTQVAVKLVDSNPEEGTYQRVIAVDKDTMKDVPGAQCILADFSDRDFRKKLSALVKEEGGKVDVVLSDMAPSFCGHKETDHLRTVELVDLALNFGCHHLRKGGNFVAKIFEGGQYNRLRKDIESCFESVRTVKPLASRSESAEMYFVGLKYIGFDNRQGGRTKTMEMQAKVVKENQKRNKIIREDKKKLKEMGPMDEPEEAPVTHVAPNSHKAWLSDDPFMYTTILREGIFRPAEKDTQSAPPGVLRPIKTNDEIKVRKVDINKPTPGLEPGAPIGGFNTPEQAIARERATEIEEEKAAAQHEEHYEFNGDGNGPFTSATNFQQKSLREVVSSPSPWGKTWEDKPRK